MSNYYDSGQVIPNQPSGAPGPYEQYNPADATNDPRYGPSQEAGNNFPVMLVTDSVVSLGSGDDTTVADRAIEAVTTTGTATESLAEVGSDALASTGTSTGSASDIAIEAATSTGTNSGSVTELGTETMTSSAASTSTLSELLLEALSTSGTSLQSLVDLQTLAEAMTSLATASQTFAELAKETATSTGTQSGLMSELQADQIAQVATSITSAAETAQEGVQSLTAASQSAGESALEVLALLTSMVNTATILEIDADVLVNLVSSSQTVSESIIDSAVDVASAIETLAERVAEVLAFSVVSSATFTDTGYNPDPPTSDDLLNQMAYTSILDDLVIAVGGKIGPFVTWPSRRRQVRRFQKGGAAKIERAAEAIAEKKRLPEHYSVGAKKAYREFQQFYGTEEGRRIFVQKALEQGRGETVVEKVNDVYKTGATVDKTKKMDVQVSVAQNRANVNVISRGVQIVKKGRL